MTFETLPPYIYDTLAPDPHPVKHAIQGWCFVVILIAFMCMLACALLLASPFLLVAWVCGGCPTGDNGPYYVLSSRRRH